MASDVLLDVMLSRNLKVRGGIISQANGYLGGFCSSQRIFPPQVSDLRQSRRLEKGGTAQSGSVVSRLQAASLTTSPFGPNVDLPPLVSGYTLGSPPHPYQRLRHNTPEPRNGVRYSSSVVP